MRPSLVNHASLARGLSLALAVTMGLGPPLVLGLRAPRWCFLVASWGLTCFGVLEGSWHLSGRSGAAPGAFRAALGTRCGIVVDSFEGPAER